MNRKTNIRKLFIVAFCIFISILGIINTFFIDQTVDNTEDINMEKDSTKEVNTEEYKFVDYQDQELPQIENETVSEAYTVSGKEIKIFFSNTKKLDASSLPLEVHSVLAEKCQKYLTSIDYEGETELVIQDDDFVDSDSEVSFLCQLEKDKFLKILFDKEKSVLKFSIVER